jgi:class 3 adenylate cyclase
MDLRERLDPEVWAQIMGRFVSGLAEGVRRYGGTVDAVAEALEVALHEPPPVLGVERLAQLHGADEVGEEHGDVLALSFDRPA